MKQFAWFLQKMEETKDIDGNSLLHNSMIVYGCGNSDGNRHTHHNLPLVLAGNGGGTLEAGRYVQAGDQPMSNLFLTMADRMGVKTPDRFGDSDKDAHRQPTFSDREVGPALRAGRFCFVGTPVRTAA